MSMTYLELATTSCIEEVASGADYGAVHFKYYPTTSDGEVCEFLAFENTDTGQ